MENRLVLNENVEDSKEVLEGSYVVTNYVNSLIISFLVLHSISELMGCDLDKETIAILTSLIQLGVNPEVLAHAVKELKREQLSPGNV